MRILAVCPDDDDHGEFLQQVCTSKGIEYRNIDLAVLAADGLCKWSNSPSPRAELDGINLGEWNVWWRRPRNPLLNTDLLDHRFRQFSSRQWEVFFKSAFRESAARIVNDPECERRAELKPIQLEAARSVGLNTPTTLITNDPHQAEEFIKTLRRAGKRCIFKTLFPGRFHFAETRAIESIGGFEEELKVCPVIFQECIEKGRDIRVTYIGEKPYACEVVTKHDELIDWRIDTAHTYRPIDLPSQIQETAVALLRRLNLHTASLDFRLDRAGDWYFFEVNPSGQFLFMVDYGYPKIGEDFVDYLIGKL